MPSTDQLVIQLLLLAAIALITVALTRSTTTSSHQAIRRLLLTGFVCTAIVSVLFPVWLTRLAQLVGVGRGADLLLYGLVIAFLGYLATAFRRFSQLERRITVLGRELALTQARVEELERARREPSGGSAASTQVRTPGDSTDHTVV